MQFKAGNLWGKFSMVYVLLILGLNLPNEISPAAKVFKNKSKCEKVEKDFRSKYQSKYKSLFTSCNKEKLIK